MTQLLDDKRLPDELRPLAACTIAYFILPADIISEDIHGPHGYAGEICLCAWAADAVHRESGREDILTENRDGEAPLMPLLPDILERETVLIGDQRDKILWHTGCNELELQLAN